MSQPVNLNKFRKSRAKIESQKRADENAVKFGRTKAEKELQTARKTKARRDLDGHDTSS